MKGDLSDCRPTVVGSRLIWYVTRNTAPVLYELPLPGGVDSAAAYEAAKILNDVVSGRTDKTPAEAAAILKAALGSRAK